MLIEANGATVIKPTRAEIREASTTPSRNNDRVEVQPITRYCHNQRYDHRQRGQGQEFGGQVLPEPQGRGDEGEERLFTFLEEHHPGDKVEAYDGEVRKDDQRHGEIQERVGQGQQECDPHHRHERPGVEESVAFLQ